MNAQNSDSFSPEVPNPLPEVGESPTVKAKEHKGAMGILSGFWHKKGPEELPKEEVVTSPVAVQEVVAPETVVAPVGILDVPPTVETPAPVPEKSHVSIMEKITHIFHKEEPTKKVEEVKVAESINTKVSEDIAPKEPEKSFAVDEKFDRLLKQDSAYHSMVRSEDIQNTQLQLSMRYMLLMLAIFVVIAWVVNNRVIMFGFSDFPLLARTRDALFAILTGLFSLTVWFGAAVWFRHRIGVIILRVLGGVLFGAVLISIYLPFWR